MAGFGGFLKAILIPAVIALILYLLLSLLVLPLIRHYRQRYNQYLPLPLSQNLQPSLTSLSSTATTLRARVSDALMLFFVPSYRNQRVRHSQMVVDGREGRGSEDDVMFDDEEGEGMVGFDIDARRREALERRRSGVGEEDRRLSRELEEGFRDDSDEESPVTTIPARR